MLKNIKNSFWYFLEQRLSKTLQWNELNCDCSDCSAVAALPPKGTHRVIILTTLEVSTSHKKLFRLFLMFTWKGQNRKCWIFWSVAVKGIFWGVPFQAGPKTLLQVSDRQSNVCWLVVAVKKCLLSLDCAYLSLLCPTGSNILYFINPFFYERADTKQMISRKTFDICWNWTNHLLFKFAAVMQPLVYKDILSLLLSTFLAFFVLFKFKWITQLDIRLVKF